MGNFHCIPDTCARVVYHEYLPPVVRWRYQGEDWNKIEGDDYQLNNLIGQCPIRYDVEYIAYYETQPFQRIVRGVFGKINMFYLLNGNLYVNQGLSHNPDANHPRILDGPGPWNDFEILSIKRQDNKPDDCGDCTLTITKNGQIVHEETRDVCPEVEKLPCRLSDETKEIKINKKPWIEGIEVIDFARGVNILGRGFPVSFNAEIPKHCLNIYNTNVSGSIVPIPNFYLEFDHIAQICSVPNCLPPEYEVICDCDCRECPPNTCAVACDGHVCCYDTSTGISVESIPSSEYCGGG